MAPAAVRADEHMAKYTIELNVKDAVVAGVDRRALRALARRALLAERPFGDGELSVMLTDDEAVPALNKLYRKKDAATDVLSFEQGEWDWNVKDGDGAPEHLGDVVISMDTAGRQAVEDGVTLQDEVSHLLVHGILHLLGYDHERKRDAAVMRAREDAILGPAHHH